VTSPYDVYAIEDYVTRTTKFQNFSKLIRKWQDFRQEVFDMKRLFFFISVINQLDAQNFCASSWLITEMHGRQNVKKNGTPTLIFST